MADVNEGSLFENCNAMNVSLHLCILLEVLIIMDCKKYGILLSRFLQKFLKKSLE